MYEYTALFINHNSNYCIKWSQLVKNNKHCSLTLTSKQLHYYTLAQLKKKDNRCLSR